MQRIAALLVPAAVLLSACGNADEAPSADSATTVAPTVPPPTTTLAPDGPLDTWPAEPPAVVFLSGPGAIEVDPFTVCWSEPPPDDPGEEYEAWCADGMPENPPTIEPSADGTVTFSFPVPGWSFSARWLTATGGIPVSPVDDTTWAFDVPDEVIDIVTVSGFGPQGDVHAAIRLPGDVTPISEDTVAVEVRDRCADGFSVSIDGELYLLIEGLDTVAPNAGFPWEPADFPEYWSVEIMNAAPVDGDNFAIFDAEASWIDDTTVAVRDRGSGDPIGTFVLDTTPPDERFFCG